MSPFTCSFTRTGQNRVLFFAWNETLTLAVMLSTPIRFLLFYFDLWGFCIGYSRSSVRTACNLIAFVVQQIFLVSALIFVIYQHIIDVRLTQQAFVANGISVMESYGSRKSQRKYWMIIQKIQQHQIYPTIQLHATMFWYISVCSSQCSPQFFLLTIFSATNCNTLYS